jgi:signal transduction histidine kinase
LNFLINDILDFA